MLNLFSLKDQQKNKNGTTDGFRRGRQSAAQLRLTKGKDSTPLQSQNNLTYRYNVSGGSATDPGFAATMKLGALPTDPGGFATRM